MSYCSLIYQEKVCSLLYSSIVTGNMCAVSGGLLGNAGKALLCLPVGKESNLVNSSEACMDD